MLEMKLDIVPYGIETERKELESLIIWNDGTGTGSFGNYKYSFSQGKEYEIKRFDRPQGALSLLKEILNKHGDI